jgi:hypothetical protein
MNIKTKDYFKLKIASKILPRFCNYFMPHSHLISLTKSQINKLINIFFKEVHCLYQRNSLDMLITINFSVG